jgi:hypothetical protein
MALPSRELNFTFLSPSSAPSRPARRGKPSQQPQRPRRRQSAMPVLRETSPAAAGVLGREVAQQVQRRLREQRGRDSGGIPVLSNIGEFGVNVARGLAPIPAGISRLIYETGRDVGQVVLSPLPGITAAPAARRLRDTGTGLAKGIAEDIGFTFGPLLDLDFKEFGRRFYEEPVRVGGTAALAYPVAGAAVGAGARAAGRATGSRALQRFGSKATVPVEGQPVPRRFREPERLNPVDIADGGMPVERIRRPRSANPITREFQRYISDPAISGIKRAVGAIPGSRNPLSPGARYQRAALNDSRNFTYNFVQGMDQDVLQTTGLWQKMVKSIPKKVGGRRQSDVVYATVALRAMGLNNLSRTQQTRTWGRDSLAETWAKSLDEMDEQQKVAYAPTIQKNIETIQKIPDEWLDPKTAPKELNALVDETRKVLDLSTEMRVKSGVITPETAGFSKKRAQYIAAGVGSEAIRMRQLYSIQKRLAARAVSKAGEVDSLKAAIASRRMDGGDTKKLESRLTVAQSELSSLQNRSKKRGQQADDLRGAVEAAVDPEMDAGSYFPNVEVLSKKSRTTKRPLAARTPRQTVPVDKPNRGIVLRRGSPSFAPDVVLGALVDSMDIAKRADALTQIVARYAVKDKDGVAITGKAAENIARNSSQYVAKTKKNLLRDMVAAEGLADDAGRMNSLMQLVEDMPFPDRVYLIPKGVDKGWREVLGSRENIIDQLNSYWKGGVLALNPRWYIQNSVGMGLQFILGAGLDLHAIKMAASPKYTKQIMADIDASGLSADLGELARKMGLRPSKNLLKRLVNFGYRFNNRNESLFRRAMFWHVATKKAREEGKKVPAMNSAAASEAWLDLAKAARKGDPNAIRLLDDIRIETTRFMGEYVRYNRFERAFMRRAFPFYGWMRAILRLGLALPFKHPKRAALIALASDAIYHMYNDDESSLLDPYTGLISGDYFIQTNIMAPQETLSPYIDILGQTAQRVAEGGIEGLSEVPVGLAQEGLRQAGPIVSIPTVVATGRSPLGIPQRLGQDDETVRDPQSGREYNINPVTGDIEDVTRVSGVEALLEQQFPILGIGKRALTPDRMRPTANATTSRLLRWYLGGRNPDEVPELFYQDPAMGRPLGSPGRAASIGSALLGAPVYRYNPNVAASQAVDRQRRFLEGIISGEKNRALTRGAYLLTNK